MGQNDIWRERDQLSCVSENVVGASFGPTGVNPNVLTDAPAGLLQALHECIDADMIFFVIHCCREQYTNAPHPVRLLRTRCERPNCRTTNKCDELSPSHSITSSAAFSKPNGTVRPSAFAVFRLMTKSNLVGCKTGRSAGFSPLRIRPV